MLKHASAAGRRRRPRLPGEGPFHGPSAARSRNVNAACPVRPRFPVSPFVIPLPPYPPFPFRRERFEFPRRLASATERVEFAPFVDRNKVAIQLVSFRVWRDVRLRGVLETADDRIPRQLRTAGKGVAMPGPQRG